MTDHNMNKIKQSDDMFFHHFPLWQGVNGNLKWRKPKATVSLKMPSEQHAAKRVAAALICTKLSMSHGASHLPQWLCSTAPACVWHPSLVPMATTPMGANGCLLPWCSTLSKRFEKVSSTQKISQRARRIARIFEKFCQCGIHGPVFQGIPVPCEFDDFLARAPCSSSRNGVNLLYTLAPTLLSIWVNDTLPQIRLWGVLFIEDVIGKVYLPHLGDVWVSAALLQCLRGSFETLLSKEWFIIVINEEVMAAIPCGRSICCWRAVRTGQEHHNPINASN